jgi:hypothetical protein
MAAKVSQKPAARVEGTRVVAFLIDNQMDLDIPDEADMLADALLDNDEPDESSSGNSYKLRYVSFADPNAPHMVAARVKGKTLTAPIGGQLLITLSKKAIDRASRTAS